MRRFLSSLLLGVLVWGFAAPLALAVTADTPAVCCRRNGKHHCLAASSLTATDDQQPAVHTVPSCCPYRMQIATPSMVARLEASSATTDLALGAMLAARVEVIVAGSGSHFRIAQR